MVLGIWNSTDNLLGLRRRVGNTPVGLLFFSVVHTCALGIRCQLTGRYKETAPRLQGQFAIGAAQPCS